VSLDLVFMGSPELSCPSLNAIMAAGHNIKAVVTQPDRKAGRGRKLTSCAVALEADQCGLLVVKPERIKHCLDEISGIKADVCVVIAFGQLLPPELLSAYPLGCINLHTSLLPALRGASPINQAILRGFSETGVTSMYMDAGMDTGDIILQKATPIGPQDTAGSLAERLSEMGADLLVRTLGLIEQGDAPRKPQDNALASHAPLMSKKDGVIDFTRPAAELDWQIRGMDPWPSAHTTYQGKMMRLFGPTALGTAPKEAKPGQVLPTPHGEDAFLWLACGRGSALGIGALQAAGKKRMASCDYLRGAQLRSGDMLGL
jgi:methionyl-tRNA formyltransferase